MNSMVYFYPEGHQAHFEQGHPERPERVEILRTSLQDAGWWDSFPKVDPLLPSEHLLQSIHHPVYLRYFYEASQQGEPLDTDTYTTPSTWDLALKTAGGAIATAACVWDGDARRGFALTRPPGHHATPTRGMGFCLLNNIALAAEYLIQEKSARRLAIIDLDLHHGNGTQEIFYRRNNVLYISTHQSPLYPGTGDLTETGEGPGEGANANFPLPPGSGDQAFKTIMSEFILPLLDRYLPEMLLISFGFDPHWRDPLGHLLLTAGGYGELVRSLTVWADEKCAGKIALFLEGGYDLDAGYACGQAVTAALLDIPWQDPLGASPHTEGKSWQVVERKAREIWGL